MSDAIPFDGPPFPIAVRTDEARFIGLPGFDFAPHYTEVGNAFARPGDPSTLRMHYIDEGPRDAPVVLMAHGEPTWCYLYRKLVPIFVAAGYRAIAIDHIGFGRSDKLTQPSHYTFETHIDRLEELVASLGLSDITLVCQDWGGPTALGVLARRPELFSGVVVANTMLHTSETEFAGRIDYANHAIDEVDQTVNASLLDWILHSTRAEEFHVSAIVAGATQRGLPQEVADAYAAPFPSQWHIAGMRQFPILIPITRNDVGTAINHEIWRALREFDRPFLTLFGDSDVSTRGWEHIFQERVPGAKGQPHGTLERAGHFWQEDAGEDAAHLIVDWMKKRNTE